jgi:hypothetical protein
VGADSSRETQERSRLVKLAWVGNTVKANRGTRWVGVMHICSLQHPYLASCSRSSCQGKAKACISSCSRLRSTHQLQKSIQTEESFRATLARSGEFPSPSSLPNQPRAEAPRTGIGRTSHPHVDTLAPRNMPCFTVQHDTTQRNPKSSFAFRPLGCVLSEYGEWSHSTTQYCSCISSPTLDSILH